MTHIYRQFDLRKSFNLKVYQRQTLNVFHTLWLVFYRFRDHKKWVSLKRFDEKEVVFKIIKKRKFARNHRLICLMHDNRPQRCIAIVLLWKWHTTTNKKCLKRDKNRQNRHNSINRETNTKKKNKKKSNISQKLTDRAEILFARIFYKACLNLCYKLHALDTLFKLPKKIV